MLQYGGKHTHKKNPIAVEDDGLAQQRERSDQHTAWGTTGLPWALHTLWSYTHSN